MEPNLASMVEMLHLHVRDLPDPEPIKDAYERARRSLKDAKTEDERYKALQKAREYGESLDFIEHTTEPVPAEVQVMRIGDLALTATPGEMFVQLGLEVKRKSATPNTFVVELANGWIGYLLNSGGFAEGGYESLPGPWTKVSEEAGGMLVDKLVEITEILWKEKQ
jgi:neutral ceramidase